MRLIDRLNGAQYIRVDDVAGEPMAFVWKGGQGVTGYDADGRELEYWQLGTADRPSEVQVERSILERISMLNGEDEEEEEEEPEEEEEAPTGWGCVDTSTEEEAE